MQPQVDGGDQSRSLSPSPSLFNSNTNTNNYTIDTRKNRKISSIGSDNNSFDSLPNVTQQNGGGNNH